MNKFLVDPSDYHIWNHYDLTQFLVQHQHKDIELTMNEGPDLDVIGLFDLLDLFKFKSVTIQTRNCLQQSSKYKIVHDPLRFNFLKVDADISTDQHLHTWNQDKIFSAFYNRPSWHRIGLAAYLYTNHRDSTLLNFRYDPANVDTRSEFDLNRLFVESPESLKNFANCFDQFPIRLESVDGYIKIGTTSKSVNLLSSYYTSILIDVVAETFVQGQTFFVTEKTVRPMLLKKPFIAMASQDYLLYLRQMGFKTFYEFWDEDYDGYAGNNRYNKILKLIDDLAQKPRHELAQMYRDMQHVLDHNYQLLIEQRYNTRINKIND